MSSVRTCSAKQSIDSFKPAQINKSSENYCKLFDERFDCRCMRRTFLSLWADKSRMRLCET